MSAALVCVYVENGNHKTDQENFYWPLLLSVRFDCQGYYHGLQTSRSFALPVSLIYQIVGLILDTFYGNKGTKRKRKNYRSNLLRELD